MKRFALLILGLCAAAEAILADGGALVLQGRAGSLTISVFATPSPLRVGPADFSVLVQNSESLDVLLDGQIELEFARRDSADIKASPTPGRATNKLLYATSVELPDAGDWKLTARCRVGDQDATVAGNIRVLPPEAPLLSYWLYFLVVPLAIALFVVNQVLKSRRRSARVRNPGLPRVS